jgi:hypothetical protein
MTDFNQVNWATITNGYLSSAKKTLSSTSKINVIINAAKGFLKATSRTGDATTLSAEQDERAFLCDDESDLEDPQAATE